MFTLGVVDYLNSLPLFSTLEERNEAQIIRELPANLTRRLDEGDCDAALIPIVDHLRGHGDGLLGDAVIGATGEVRSVMLFSKVPFGKITSVAADTSSHTSVALIRILLPALYGCRPQFMDAAPNLAEMLRHHDAALLIGDPALEAMQAPHDEYVLDLAEGWQRLTGLPFVFAAWVARKGLEPSLKQALAALLNQARDEGKATVSTIVKQNSTSSHLPEAVREEYLDRIIQHTAGPEHFKAIEEFGRRLG